MIGCPIARRGSKHFRVVAVRGVALLVLAASAGAQATSGDPARGKALVALAGGCGCHDTKDGPVGAGGRRLPTPFGAFFSTNITPDRETGIGDWTDEEIIAAIREGYVRGKGVEAPVMPYYAYAGMSDRDVRDVVAYLRALPPVRRENQPHQVDLPFARLAFRVWRFLFTSPPSPPAEAPAAGLERGRYLAQHVAICGDCHTPRDRFGVPQADRYLSGTEHGPFGKAVPNITPDQKTGIADWDADDIAHLLASGQKPDFDNVQGLMAEVIDGYGDGLGYADAPGADLEAVAAYLKSINPLEHQVKRD